MNDRDNIDQNEVNIYEKVLGRPTLIIERKLYPCGCKIEKYEINRNVFTRCEKHKGLVIAKV